MPVKSRAEAAYLGIHHPEVLKKWKAEGINTSPKGLPGHVKKLKDRMAAMGVK